MQGSEDYDCEIKLDKHGNWQDGECDCPYDWGDVCKHQAALWYAVQAQDFSQIPSEMDTLNAQLAPLSAEKLRELLCQLINIYEKQGKTQAKSQLLYEMIFAIQNIDFIESYREWKATIAAENWERECNKIAPQIKKLSQHNYLLLLREEYR